ncbi:DUF2156 domain-containing protein [Thermodesulfobacteriota bacterium]
MKEIRQLSQNDRDIVSGYLAKYPPEISESTFTNLFVWRQSRPLFVFEHHKTLVFLLPQPLEDTNQFILFGPPIGTAPLPDILEMFEYPVIGAIRFSEKEAEKLQKSGYEIKEDRDNADYVYLTEDLMHLTGRRYAKKRNLIKQCLNSHNCVYEPLTRHNIPECSTFLDRWCHSRQCGKNPGLCTEFHALRETLFQYDYFNLIGGVIRIDGIIQAFAIAEQLRSDTAVCHFEKANPEIRGLPQLIIQWFTRNSLGQFKYVNREQDLGLPGLRHAKESYYPDHMVMKYLIQFEHTGTMLSGKEKGIQVTECTMTHECREQD